MHCTKALGARQQVGAESQSQIPSPSLGPSTAYGSNTSKNCHQVAAIWASGGVSGVRGRNDGWGSRHSSISQGKWNACHDFLWSSPTQASPFPSAPMFLNPEPEPSQRPEQVQDLAHPPQGRGNSQSRNTCVPTDFLALWHDEKGPLTVLE